MTGRLIIQSADGAAETYLDLSESVHRSYAARCGADYLRHHGRVESDVHPAWNRLPLMRQAFADGYEKVVWFDADVLVVDPGRNIFAETDDLTPLLLKRAYVPWQDRPDCWNDGVIVANATGGVADDALAWVWEQRRTPFLDHHIPGMWELNWLNDWAAYADGSSNRWVVDYLDPTWNWMPIDMTTYGPDEAAILAFHGMPHAERWAAFRAAFGGSRDYY